MTVPIVGLHHVTAIAGDAQASVDFYSGVLGLRLVKRTVNFDAPDMYHLYFGDEVGHPGTILTFFPWPGAARGRKGTGQVTVTAFAIPHDAVGFWSERLTRRGVAIDGPERRFDDEVLTFHDPDGLQLELVTDQAAQQNTPWMDGPIVPDRAIRGLHGVTICAAGYERTATLLTETMGFGAGRSDRDRFRFIAGAGPSSGGSVDIVCKPGQARGHIAVGTVHHIAFRVPGDREQLEWRQTLAAAGLDVTPPMDRQYFRSIYFREPGGVLFELATDSPGFTADESIADLGSHLKLPPWVERARSDIEAALPPIHVPVPEAP
jgi:glyoxalase family protein